MKSENTQSWNLTEKFRSPEQLWFWFLYTKSAQSDMSRCNLRPTHRPCELLDVESLITRLYLSGRITDEQLVVLKEFGDKRRAPNQYIWAENRSYYLWSTALHTIGKAATARGWIA